MSDEGKVSTADTPPPRDDVRVTVDDAGGLPPTEAATAEPPPTEGQSKTTDAPAATADETQAKPRSRRSQQREVRRTKEALRKANEQNEALSNRLESLERTVESLTATPPEKAPEPVLADFDTPQAFGEAYAKWKTPEAPPAPPAKAKAPVPKADIVIPEDPFKEQRENLRKTGIEKYGDEYAAVMSDDSDLPISLDMRDVLFESDVGPEIVMWLDDHRDQAEKIYAMGPGAADKAMMKIEELVTANPPDREGEIRVEDPPANAAVTKTSQPEPPETVRTAAAAPGEFDYANASMEDYATQRRAEEAKNRMN